MGSKLGDDDVPPPAVDWPHAAADAGDTVGGWGGVERALAYVDQLVDTLEDGDVTDDQLTRRPSGDDVVDDVDEDTRRCISDACHLL